mmetsp:Transcript_14733/g.21999  ORF Transcript_14733/g.21999 Transcript_14733/m.21999 type:complete len:233 (+) Transcript_14733:642-1340(+)
MVPNRLVLNASRLPNLCAPSMMSARAAQRSWCLKKLKKTNQLSFGIFLVVSQQVVLPRQLRVVVTVQLVLLTSVRLIHVYSVCLTQLARCNASLRLKISSIVPCSIPTMCLSSMCLTRCLCGLVKVPTRTNVVLLLVKLSSISPKTIVQHICQSCVWLKDQKTWSFLLCLMMLLVNHRPKVHVHNVTKPRSTRTTSRQSINNRFSQHGREMTRLVFLGSILTPKSIHQTMNG